MARETLPQMLKTTMRETKTVEMHGQQLILLGGWWGRGRRRERYSPFQDCM